MSTFISFAIQHPGTARWRFFFQGDNPHFRHSATKRYLERVGVIMGFSGSQKYWRGAFGCLFGAGCFGHWFVTDQMP